MSRRISEKEILDETLKLLAKQRDKTLTTSELINLLTTEFEPAGKDSEIIQGRSDTYFSQKACVGRKNSKTSSSKTQSIGAFF